VITVGGFNTSLDKALEADELRLGAVNRARDILVYPGGKGLHVALTIAALGEPVRLVGLIDAAHRREFEDVLGGRGVVFDSVEAGGPLRTCLALRDLGGARVTEILEPGPSIDTDTRRELQARFLEHASRSAVAVLSGSAPPGFDDGVYGDLVSATRNAGVRCLVDTSGGLLRQAVEARPFLIKPNRDEAEALAGHTIDGPEAAARVGRALVARGIGMVVVSLGAAGAIAAGPDGVIHARVSVPAVANPVGSGDCLLGGVAVGLARGATMADALRLGVACGAANVLTSETGRVRREDVEVLLARVESAAIA